MKRWFVLLAILLPCFAFGQWGMQKKWHPMGPFEWPEQGVDSGQWSANGLGWIESLAVFESDPSIMYAGSGTGGLYRTQNGGKTWTFAFDVERVCGVTDIVLDEHNPNHLWVATGTTYWDLDWGLGVLESFNGGRSWVTTGLYFRPEDQKPLWCLKRSSQNPDLFFACSETDIFRSRDGGKNWEVVFDRPDDSRVHFRHLSIHPTNDQRIVASGDYVLTSMDGGTTWEDQSTKLMYRNQLTKTDSLPGRFAHAVNPQHGDQLLVAYSYRYKDYVERSNDFGQTWEVILARSTFNRLDRTHAEIAWHPTDSNVVLIGCVRAFVSEDLGKTFRVSTQPKVDGADYVHDDIRAITITKDGLMYLGNDGGVAVSMDTGRTWSNVSGKGLTVTQFFDIAADYGRLAGGCQDLSSMLWVDGTWRNTSQIYGDGGNNLVLDSAVFVMHSGSLQRGTFQNQKWSPIRVPYSAGRFSYPFMLNPWDSSAIWVTDHHLWEYDLDQPNWKNRSERITPGITKITALATHKESGLIVMAKDQPTWNDQRSGLTGRLFKGMYQGDEIQWTDVTSTFGIVAWRSISDVAINPKNAQEVVVCLRGYDQADRRFKVYRSLDGGQTWNNMSNGLPDLLCNRLRFTVSGDYLLMGTDEGVFYFDRSANAWKEFGRKMPAYHITDIELDYPSRSIYLATFGGGVWRMKMPRKIYNRRSKNE